MTPAQLALQSKPQLQALGYAVDAQGNVTRPGSGGGLFPPWSWAPDLTQDPTQRRLLSTPASDPSSPWRASMGYDEGGPFSHRSVWDSSNGTYQGGIDWATLLGTIGAGSLIGAGAAAAIGGGGSGAAASSAAASNGVPFTTSGAATVGGSVAAPTAAGGSTVGSLLSGSNPWLSLVGTGVNAFSNLYGANMSANAAKDAGAAQLQATREALDFERQQAQYGAQAHEVDRRANWEQWQAHMQGVNSIGRWLGMGTKPVPAYVPGPPPTYLNPSAATSVARFLQ